jgi:hypothetical protein
VEVIAQLLIQRAETKQKEISSLQDEACKLIESRAHLGSGTSEEDLTLSLSKFDGYIVRLFRIKNGLERELAAAAGDNRIHGARRIKALHRHG